MPMPMHTPMPMPMHTPMRMHTHYLQAVDLGLPTPSLFSDGGYATVGSSVISTSTSTLSPAQPQSPTPTPTPTATPTPTRRTRPITTRSLRTRWTSPQSDSG